MSSGGKWGLTMCCFVLWFPVVGQHTFSLDECMRYAVEHNLTLANSRLDVSIGRTDYTAGIGSLLPKVSAGSSFGKRFGRSVDPTTNQYTAANFAEGTVNFNVSVPLFEGFSRINRIAFQRLNLSIKRLAVDCQQSEMEFEVMDAFYKVVFEDRLEELAAEQRRLSERYMRQTEMFLELGLRAESDLQEMKARLESDIYQEILRHNNRQTALLQLKLLLNLTKSDTFQIRYDTTCISIPQATGAEAGSVYEMAQEYLPDFKIIELQEKAAYKSRAIAIGGLFPSLTGEFDLYSGYYGTEVNDSGGKIAFHTQLKDNVRKYVGVTLSIPILNGLQGMTEVRREGWKLEQTRNSAELQRQELYTEIETSCLELRAAFREWEQAMARVEVESAALSLSERKWEEGLLSVFELMEIRNRCISAKAEVTRTGLQYEIKRRTVNYFKGGTLY